ncbi:MAG TPA: hypothetical protein PLS49_05805 [Candidatus Woesebacteria bacterium]|nr:hypothetical protein [Candidatus Woesebacteria bacterium]
MKKNIIIITLIFLIFIFVLSNNKDKNNDRNQVDTVAKPSLTKSPTQLEEEKNLKAKKYCDERKTSQRYYPIVKESQDIEDNIGYQIDNKISKTGENLTHDNCRIAINFLYKLAEKGNVDIDYIIEGRYWIGMNIVELFLSVGFPDKENISNYGSGETSQYIYYKDSRRINALYIYLEEGKVTSYQDY